MAIKKYKPTTPSLRFRTGYTFTEITTDRPEKSLLKPLKKSGGRNNMGRITCRHRGGGHRRHYRIIDFKRDKFGVPAKVASIEYDPNRTARIALLHYLDGEKRYIIAPDGLTVGSKVMSGPEAEIALGNAIPLEKIPLGSTVHNIELKKGRGGQIGVGFAFAFHPGQRAQPLLNCLLLFGITGRRLFHAAPQDPGLQQGGGLALILPVIQALVVGQHDVHIRGIRGVSVGKSGTLLQRVQRAADGFFLSQLGAVQRAEQQNQKDHVVRQRQTPQLPVLTAQGAAQPAIHRAVTLPGAL